MSTPVLLPQHFVRAPDGVYCDQCIEVDFPRLLGSTDTLDSTDSIGVLRRMLFDQEDGQLGDGTFCSACKCRLLTDIYTLDHTLHSHGSKTWYITADTKDENGNHMGHMELSIYVDPTRVEVQGKRDNQRYYFAFPESFVPRPSIRKQNRYRGNLRLRGPKPSYDMLRSWLVKCEAEHNHRPDLLASRSPPTLRVVDVSRRLLVNLPPGKRYLALSYLWGGFPQPSVESLGPIPESLPLTIEHALHIVKELGEIYLWVDSVSIDQSDEVGKEEQIRNMDLVYSGAYATIVVPEGTANSGIPGVNGQGRDVKQIYAYVGEHCLLSILPGIDEAISDSTWAGRGWTLQEGLLSRRCLIFSKHQAYFHCNTMTCAESHSFEDGSTHYGNHCGFINPIESGLDNDRPYDALHIWNSLVREYFKRSLTNDNDTLHAVAGILSRLETTIFQDGFLFGLSRARFRHFLCWSRRNDSRGRRNHTFPSWSWAGWRFPGNTWMSVGEGIQCRTCCPPLSVHFQGRPVDVDLNSPFLEVKDWYWENSTAWEKSLYEAIDFEISTLFSKVREEHPDPSDLKANFDPEKALLIKGIVLSIQCRISNSRWDSHTYIFEHPPIYEDIHNLRFDVESPLSCQLSKNGTTLSSDDENGRVIDMLVMKSHAPVAQHLKEFQRFVHVECIVLEWNNGIASRAGHTTFSLDVEPWSKGWESLNPRIQTFWMV